MSQQFSEPALLSTDSEKAAQIQANWTVAPTFDSQLPIVFQSGVRLLTMEYACAACNTHIPGDAVRGAITRPTPTTALLEGWGRCPSCGTWSPFDFIVRGDHGIKFEWRLSNGGWVPSMASSSHTPLKKRLLRAGAWVRERVSLGRGRS